MVNTDWNCLNLYKILAKWYHFELDLSFWLRLNINYFAWHFAEIFDFFLSRFFLWDNWIVWIFSSTLTLSWHGENLPIDGAHVNGSAMKRALAELKVTVDVLTLVLFHLVCWRRREHSFIQCQWSSSSNDSLQMEMSIIIYGLAHQEMENERKMSNCMCFAVSICVIAMIWSPKGKIATTVSELEQNLYGNLKFKSTKWKFVWFDLISAREKCEKWWENLLRWAQFSHNRYKYKRYLLRLDHFLFHSFVAERETTNSYLLSGRWENCEK